MVEMTRDGFTFLVMGFTGAKAAQFKEQYISEFNKMEAYIRSGGVKQVGATPGIEEAIRQLRLALTAEMFGKEHKDTLKRTQRLECSAEFAELNFELCEYTDPILDSMKSLRKTPATSQELDCSEDFREGNFSLSNYTVPGNRRPYPMVELTRGGFTKARAAQASKAWQWSDTLRE